MYQNEIKINGTLDQAFFDRLLKLASEELTAKDNPSPEQYASYTQAFYNQMMEMINSTPAVYYQTLREAFDPVNPRDLRTLIDTKDFPYDLLADIDNQNPDAVYHFLTHLREADVPVLDEYEANRFFSNTKSFLELDRIAEEETVNPLLSEPPYNKRIGETAAASRVLSRMIEHTVAHRLGLDAFSIPDETTPEGIKLYDELMQTVADTPAVYYGLLHSIADSRLLPAFYENIGRDYLEDHESTADGYGEFETESARWVQRFESALHDASRAVLTVQKPTEALQYFDFYASREAPAVTAPHGSDQRLTEELRCVDQNAKIAAGEREAAKKAADVRFGNYMSQMQKNRALYADEIDLLTNMSKIYKKENARLDSVNKKYMKAQLEVQKLQTIDDLKIMTAKEQLKHNKKLSKAMSALEKSEARVQAVKDDLIAQNERRAAQNGRFPEHFELRKEQILSGDTTYMPLQTREDSINNRMYACEAQLYVNARDEILSPEPIVGTAAVPDLPRNEPTRRTANLSMMFQSTTRQVGRTAPSEQSGPTQAERESRPMDLEPDELQ